MSRGLVIIGRISTTLSKSLIRQNLVQNTSGSWFWGLGKINSYISSLCCRCYWLRLEIAQLFFFAFFQVWKKLCGIRDDKCIQEAIFCKFVHIGRSILLHIARYICTYIVQEYIYVWKKLKCNKEIFRLMLYDYLFLFPFHFRN